VARRLPAQLALGVRSDRAETDAKEESARGRPDGDAADFRQRVSGITSISQGAKFAPNAGDPHDALYHFILAINAKSADVYLGRKLLSTMSHGVTLGCSVHRSPSIATTIRCGRNWPSFRRETPESLPRLHRPPADRGSGGSVNVFRLTAFLVARKGFHRADLRREWSFWESMKYKNQPTWKVRQRRRAKGQIKEVEKVAL